MVKTVPSVSAALCCTALMLGAMATTGATAAPSAPPFPIKPQNPFIQIFGLPTNAPAALTDSKGIESELYIDITNNSMIDQADNDAISIDGESYRTTLMLRKRYNEQMELGLELPFVAHRPGKMDNLIEGYHDAIGFSNAERSKTPSNTLDYSYSRNGVRMAGFTEGHTGLADISLHGAYQLQRDDLNGRALSLRAALKLPTGDAERLRGSEGTDLALYISGADNQLLKSLNLESYGQAGLLFMGKGEVLPELQNSVVGFASFGVTWNYNTWLDLKAQLNTHSSFYDSEVKQLGGSGIQLTVGGTLYLSDLMAIDIGFGENLFTDTTPDFLINLVFRADPK